MSLSYTDFGHLFNKSGTATTTETTAANAPWDANGCRPRKITLANDGSVSLLYRLSIDSAEQFTLKAGEEIKHDVISNGLQVEAASATCAFRAWGAG